MSDYFSKLGSLLSQALDSGEIPSEHTDAKADEELRFSKQPSPAKALPNRVQKALKTLSIPADASFEEARKIYREKLQRFHPDKHGDNAVLQKVARTKTAAFIEAWKSVEAYYADGADDSLASR